VPGDLPKRRAGLVSYVRDAFTAGPGVVVSGIRRISLLRILLLHVPALIVLLAAMVSCQARYG
jgi:hypothetical protein